MEEFEIKAINSVPHPPMFLQRYVDDTFVTQKAEHSNGLLQHIYSIDLHIQFTLETAYAHGSIPFLDTFVSPGSDTTPAHYSLQEAHLQ